MIRLFNGIINHGTQNLDEETQDEPTAYYERESGVGYAMKLVSEREHKRVGMLGLGIGTIAAYASEGDYFRAYEINQDVIDLALNPEIFTFWSLLEQRGARGDVILGDARISLENELRAGQRQEFDILVLDVFSGDAIPVHLLTVEAFQIYKQHMAPHGLLAVHISNRHLDLLPVVQTMAEHFSMAAGMVDVPESRWVLLGSLPALQLLKKQQPEQLRPLGPRETAALDGRFQRYPERVKIVGRLRSTTTVVDRAIPRLNQMNFLRRGSRCGIKSNSYSFFFGPSLPVLLLLPSGRILFSYFPTTTPRKRSVLTGHGLTRHPISIASRAKAVCSSIRSAPIRFADRRVRAS